jgi:hypothetical protein
MISHDTYGKSKKSLANVSEEISHFIIYAQAVVSWDGRIS